MAPRRGATVPWGSRPRRRSRGRRGARGRQSARALGLSRSATLAALTALVLALVGCGGPPPVRDLPPRPDYRTASLDELVRRANAWTSPSLRASGRLRLFWAGTDDSDHVDVQLLANRAGALLMQGKRSIVGTIFTLASDGFEFELSVPDHEAVYTGDATVPAEPYPQRPYLALRPRHVTEALLPAPLPVPGDPDVPADSGVLGEGAAGEAGQEIRERLQLETWPDRYAVTWVDERGRLRRRVWFDRLDLRVERVQGFDEEGRIDQVASYSGWLSPEETAYPGRVRVERPWEDLAFEFEIEEARRDVRLRREQLRPARPESYRILTIQEAIAELRARDRQR